MMNEQAHKIRVLIVDDEALARGLLRRFLRPEGDIEIVGEARNGREAIDLIAQHEPDLVFLDVQMPELTGFEVIERLKVQNLPEIIFVTAYDRYALRAFEVHALDYLLKPFSKKRFQAALQRARRQVQERVTGSMSFKLERLLAELRNGPNYLQRLAIHEDGGVHFIDAAEIDWVEAAGKYVRVHTGKRSHLVREGLQALEAKLDPDKFLRVHRSALVCLNSIKTIERWFNGNFMILLNNGARVASSRSYRSRLQLLCSNVSHFRSQ